MSETLARQNPSSPFRRAPSSVLTRAATTSALSLQQENEEVLRLARDDLQKLREREEKVLYCFSSERTWLDAFSTYMCYSYLLIEPSPFLTSGFLDWLNCR